MSDDKQQNLHLPFFGIPRVLPYLKDLKPFYISMIVTGLIASGIDILLPMFQKYALDNFIGKNTLSGILWFALLYAAVLSVQVACNYISTANSGKIEMGTLHHLRKACFHHLQSLSFSYFDQNSVGYVHARVMSDTSRIGEVVSWNLMDAVWNVTYLVGAIVTMLVINWKLAIAVIVVVPVAAILISSFHGRLVRLNRRIREKNSIITGDFNEGITGAKTIKSLVIEDKINGEFRRDTAEMKTMAVRATKYRAFFWSTVSFCSYAALALVLWQGGILTREQVIELGTLSVFMNYAQGIMEPVIWIVDTVSNMIAIQVNIERVTHLLSTESDVADRKEVTEKYGDAFVPKKENWEELHGQVEFRDVTFRYPTGEETVLEHFNLKVEEGQIVAIVGETGAGKSTLVSLVCRFYEPTDGQILIDGVDARERSQLWLHSHIGYVLQTPHLFSGTVRENLLYGNPDATEEQIREALERTSALEVVEKMEKGLDSEVGEGGDLLSTGEKQLLSFARAILADPRILVLDEATSSIDTMTEHKIQKAIGEVTHGRTTFMIAHRLSTVRDADTVLVVKAGKIVEQGTHRELMAMKGYYYSLYTRQFEEEATGAALA